MVYASLEFYRSDSVNAWVARLDELRVDHSPVTEGALGWLIVFDDPDGIQLKLYTQDVHGLKRPGRECLGQRTGAGMISASFPNRSSRPGFG